MGNPTWTTRKLFTSAVALPVERREDFVALSNATDQMKAEVMELLRIHQQGDDDFLQPTSLDEFDFGFTQVGDYKIVRRVAAGGMGVVFEGVDTRLKRRVAIKVLPPYLSDLPDARSRLIHEARVAARLEHQGIVPVFDVVISSSVVAIVSQYVDGQTFDELLHERAHSDSVDARATAEQFIMIARALHHAHGSGVVHRDIKPSNILIDSATGHPRITDFGIAKVLTQTEVMHTSTGAGTCYYMSPEQTREDSEGIGPCSDIFSLGIVLYQVLTGKRPFDGSTRDSVIDAIRSGHVIQPRQHNSAIPHDLELVCLKMLEIDPGYRYRSCADLSGDLDRYLRGVPVRASPPSIGRLTRELMMNRRQALVRAGLLTVGVSGGAYIATRLVDSRATVSIRTGADDAQVQIQQWQPSEMRFTLLSRDRGGRSSFRAERGIYRISISTSEGGKAVLREFDRYVDTDDVYILGSVYAETPDLDTMVPIDPIQLGLDEGAVSQEYYDLVKHVEPFLIDRFEVSCGQYRRFILATGYPQPPLWPTPYDERWDDLPVTTVTGLDATTYAEWAGKRLPTFPEWQLMARGKQEYRYPWEGTSSDAPEMAYAGGGREGAFANWGMIDDAARRMGSSYAIERDHFLSRVRPVHQVSKDIRSVNESGSQGTNTQRSIHNLFGNVSEWTSTPFAWNPSGRKLEINYRARFICGLPWGQLGRRDTEADLRTYSVDDVGLMTTGRGFRCAISNPQRLSQN
jgi:formylglycine-generating enzyme required for sulfatase activity/tRNA A-37 threonylcarbamoyl transferase component Bud32